MSRGNGIDGGDVRSIWDALRKKKSANRNFSIWPLFLILLAAWLITGVYTVEPGEIGVVKRFGKASYETHPGLRYHLPWPVETVDKVNIAKIRRVEIGFRSEPVYTLVKKESLMLTGDENIVDTQAIVQYRVKEPVNYLFKVRNPDEALKDAAEVSIRGMVGQTTIDHVLTVGRVEIQEKALNFLQHLLDSYESGLVITDLKLQVVDPPEEVKDSFHEVVRAREDRERLINQARGYMEDVLPRARGEAERRLRAAEAYREEKIILAEGEAARFEQILEEYSKSPEITRQRLYLETLENTLPDTEKIVIDSDSAGNVLQLLPLRGSSGLSGSKDLPLSGKRTDEGGKR